MTTYIPILNSEIDPESPVTESLAQRFRDNPIAIAEGDSAAPRINPAAISIGGKGSDGVLNNSTTISLSGFLDFEGGAVRSTALTLPLCTIIRINGNFTLSGGVSVAKRSLTDATNIADALRLSDLLDVKIGAEGGDDGGTTGFGGNSFGLGGDSFGSAFSSPASIAKWWIQRRLFIGGNGGLRSGGAGGREWGPGGGAVMLIVEGDLDATGGEINANGLDTDNLGPGGNDPGGGAGGSVIVICTGTIKNGTFKAKGGISNVGGNGLGGAGGGGLVQLIASAFLGTQTIDVAGGASYTAGAAGYSNSLTLGADFIRTLLQRL